MSEQYPAGNVSLRSASPVGVTPLFLLTLGSSVFVLLAPAPETEITTFEIGTTVAADKIYVNITDADENKNYLLQETVTCTVRSLPAVVTTPL